MFKDFIHNTLALSISLIDCVAQDKVAEAEKALRQGHLDKAIDIYDTILQATQHMPFNAGNSKGLI